MRKYFVVLKNRDVTNWSLWLDVQASEIDQYLHAIAHYKLALSIANPDSPKWFNSKHVPKPSV